MVFPKMRCLTPQLSQVDPNIWCTDLNVQSTPQSLPRHITFNPLGPCSNQNVGDYPRHSKSHLAVMPTKLELFPTTYGIPCASHHPSQCLYNLVGYTQPIKHWCPQNMALSPTSQGIIPQITHESKNIMHVVQANNPKFSPTWETSILSHLLVTTLG